MREQVETLVIDDYPSSEYLFALSENYFLVEPSVRPWTQETYEGLLDYVADGIGLGSNLVSYIAPSRGKRVYWEVGETAARPGLLRVRSRVVCEKLLVL